MPKLEKKKQPVPFLTLDCESDPFAYGRIPEPFLWGVYDGSTGDYWEFETSGEVVDFLRDKKVIVYAHNGGKFDYHFLSEHFEPGEPMLIINGRLSRFKIGKCEFRDSYNILPIALAQYQKTEIEYWKLEKEVRSEHMAEIRAYLKSDCINLWNLIDGFEREFGRHLTQASAAMRIWQRMCKVKAPRSSETFYDLFKPYYYGGRVQCFKAGVFDVRAFSVDIRSAYPAAMLSKHPISLEYVAGTGCPDYPRSQWGPFLFTVRGVARGCFPYRGLNNMLYYPADDVRRTYRITGHELLAALDTGTLEDDWEILEWTRFLGEIDFAPYIEHFWTERQKAKAAGDAGRVQYCKIFMNGLYGKFAADPRQYVDYFLAPPSFLAKVVEAGQEFSYFREWLLVAGERKKERHVFYHIATAASITGLVRANLWRAILKCKDVYYCDTDSITAGDVSALDVGDQLGQFGIEGEYDRLILCGKKLYAFHKIGRPWSDSLEKGHENWKKATKGARLTAEELERIAAGELVTFRPEVPTFSTKHSGPRFVSRALKITAADVSYVPKEVDPEFRRL